MRRLLPALPAALLLLPLVASPADAVQPVYTHGSETVLVPARDGVEPLLPLERRWNASRWGVAYALGDDDLAPRTSFRTAGSSTAHELEEVGDAQVAVGPDAVLVLPYGYDITQGRDVRLLDPSTGARTGSVRVNGSLLAAVPGGVTTFVTSLTATREVRLTSLSDGSVRTLLTTDLQVDAVAADERGAVVALRRADGSAVDVVAADLDGRQHVLASYPRSSSVAFPVQHLALNATSVALRATGPQGGTSIDLLPRDGSGPGTSRTVDDVQGLALLDDAVAWTSAPGGRITLSTAPLDPAAPATSFEPGNITSTTELQAGPGGFVVPQGRGTAVPGFALVRPGATALEPYVTAPPRPALLDDVALDSGRLVVDDDALDGDLAVRTVDVSGGRVQLGAEQVRPLPAGAAAQTLRGARVLTVEVASDGALSVVVSEAGRVLRRVPVGPDLQDADLSGRRLLVSTGNDAGTTGTSRVVDVPTGATLDLPVGAALWGPYVAYVDAQGTLVRRDLDRPGSALVVLRRGVPRDALVQVDGDDVLVDTLTSAADAATLHRVRAGTVTSATVPGSGPDTDLVLSGGVVAEQGSLSVGVLSADDVLAGRAPATVGYTAGDVLPAVDDDVVVWEEGDGRLRVRPLPQDVARPARLLSSTAASGTTGAWSFEAEASEALRSWTLELRDAGGRVVATRSAQDRSSSVRAAWDGRLPDGRTAPEGVYRWTLSGVDLDGDGLLAGADGGAVPTGTVALRRSAPTLGLTAPVLSTQESAGRSFPVRWTAPAGLRVDLSWAEVVGGVAGAAKPWITGTTARSAVFGVTGAPRVQDGRTYRITAVAHDELGRSSAVRATTTVVPFDDRASAVRYAGAWSSAAASGRYAGTLRTSTARGATATFVGSGRSLRVVVDRCPTCGKVAVVLDGRTVATVDTRASKVQPRQSVWARSFSATGRHTLQLKVVSGRVALDGIALGQQ